MRSSVSSAVTGQAALGTLYIKPVLNEPNRVHYGPEDVNGKVLLKYVPPPKYLSTATGNAGIFGPLRVDVTLKGTVRVLHEDESRADITNLFTKSVKIYDGAFRAEEEVEHSYPFTLTFPENAQLKAHGGNVTAVQDETGGWSFRSQVNNVDVVPLPPSMESRVHDATTVSMIRPVYRTVAAVRYTFSAQAKMPGIDVDIIIANGNANANEDETIFYDQPRVPMTVATNNLIRSTQFEQKLSLEDSCLRTNEEKPSGFLGKTKALLKSTELPKYAFTATVSGIPQHAFIGQPVSFNISISSDPSSTTKINPDVYLESCKITLLAHTQCHIDGKPANIEVIRSKEAELPQRWPFSDQHGWNRTIDVGVLSWVPSTFTFGDVSRSYKLRIASQFSVGKEKLHTRRDVPISIHSPLLLDDAGDAAPEIGLTRVNSGGSTVLPGYEEALAEAPSQPSYEDATAGETQPSYEQAMSDSMNHHSGIDAHAHHNVPTDHHSTTTSSAMHSST